MKGPFKTCCLYSLVIFCSLFQTLKAESLELQFARYSLNGKSQKSHTLEGVNQPKRDDTFELWDPSFSWGLFFTQVESKQDSLSSGNGFGAFFRGDVSDRYGFRLMVTRYTQDMNPILAGSGELSVTPVILNGEYRWLRGERLTSHILVGAGVYYVKNNYNGEFQDFLSRFNLDYTEEIDSTFGHQYGAGLQLYLNQGQTFSVWADYLLFKAQPTANGILTDKSTGAQAAFSDTLDLSGRFLNVGFSHYF